MVNIGESWLIDGELMAWQWLLINEDVDNGQIIKNAGTWGLTRTPCGPNHIWAIWQTPNVSSSGWYWHILTKYGVVNGVNNREEPASTNQQLPCWSATRSSRWSSRGSSLSPWGHGQSSWLYAHCQNKKCRSDPHGTVVPQPCGSQKIIVAMDGK